MKDLKLPDGRDRLVRRGHGPLRTIQTGIGPVEVARAKIRDRGAAGAGERITFTSAILPLWATDEEPGRFVAGALPTGHLDRRLPGCAWSLAGQGCPELVAGGDFPADVGVAKRV